MHFYGDVMHFSRLRCSHFLIFRGRILTHDVMDRRGIPCEKLCCLCDSCEMEDVCHLFFECIYAQRV